MRVKFFRDGTEETRTIVIEELPIETERKALPSMPSQHGGLTFGAITPSWAKRFDVPQGLSGALIVKVDPGSSADEADLNVGDIIRAINRHPVQSLTDAKRELDAIERDRPIFLLVWRRGKELFLQLRRA